MLFHKRHYCLEHRRIILGEVGEDLAVKRHFFLFERGNELAVAHTFGADGGVDLHGPQAAEVPLFFLAAAEGMRPGVEERFFRGAFFGLAAPAEALRMLEDVLSALIGYGAPFYSWHG